MAISIDKVEYTPDPIVAGKKVKATFKVSADAGVASVKLYTPDYRTLEAHSEGNDGVYTLETEAPYDAPPGIYDVTVVVTDKNGEVLRKSYSVRVG